MISAPLHAHTVELVQSKSLLADCHKEIEQFTEWNSAAFLKVLNLIWAQMNHIVSQHGISHVEERGQIFGIFLSTCICPSHFAHLGLSHFQVDRRMIISNMPSSVRIVQQGALSGKLNMSKHHSQARALNLL